MKAGNSNIRSDVRSGKKVAAILGSALLFAAGVTTIYLPHYTGIERVTPDPNLYPQGTRGSRGSMWANIDRQAKTASKADSES